MMAALCLFIAQGQPGAAVPVNQASPNVDPLDTAKRHAAPEHFGREQHTYPSVDHEREHDNEP